MATFDPDSASFRAIPRPIPREPPVTSAYFPLSVTRHLLAQILWRILGRGKVRVNARGGDACIAERTDCDAKDYFFSGYNLILRKNTSAPSDWNKIFPLEGNACEPSLANFPLTNCLT